MSHEKVSKAVEAICNQGCTVVNEIIETLEQGEDITETNQLTPAERGELLHELKTIMRVYENR